MVYRQVHIRHPSTGESIEGIRLILFISHVVACCKLSSSSNQAKEVDKSLSYFCLGPATGKCVTISLFLRRTEEPYCAYLWREANKHQTLGLLSTTSGVQRIAHELGDLDQWAEQYAPMSMMSCSDVHISTDDVLIDIWYTPSMCKIKFPKNRFSTKSGNFV